MLRAKWLEELEKDKSSGILLRYKERHTRGYHKAAIRRYFIKETLYILSGIYQMWYQQRENNNWENFNIQFKTNVT